MKNQISWMARFLALGVAFCSAGRAWADEWTDPDTGITWIYGISGDNAILGGGNSLSTAVPKSTSGFLTIPSTLDGYKVTSIGAYAFYGCNGLASVTIPNSVTSIGAYAFRNCSELTSVTMPDSVTSVAYGAFYGCGRLASVAIPIGVTSIGNYTFRGCSGLTSVTIPGSVTTIAYGAFYGCSGLAGVKIPDNVTSIGSHAFSGCSGLASVKIPDNVTSIAYGAFSGCSGLTSVTIPDSVTSIGSHAFSGCRGLTSVTIPNRVRSIGSHVFYGCSGLTSVKISDSVTSIGSHVFSGCSGLTSVKIPDSVVVIGSYAFSGCSGLASVTIPNRVRRIDSGAFSGCSGLTSVKIPDSVTSIGEGAFSDCDELVYDDETIPGVLLLDGWVVGYIDTLSGNLDLAGVRGIAGGAFSGCRGLTSVKIPDTVTIIGRLVFYQCSGLTSVTIPNSVRSIWYMAFYGCSGLTSVTIPGLVTFIGDYAFYGCSGLTSVKIPDSVTSIESRAFENCDESVFDKETIPGVLLLDGWVVGYNGTLSGNLDLTGVRGIASSAFAYCSDLTSVKIPEGVTIIGQSVFCQCSGLTSVTIPDSVTSIAYCAFRGCSGLASVTIPNRVANIDNQAFCECENLKSITFKGNAPEVEEDTFESVPSTCVVKVLRGSTGWGVDIPGTWQGMIIEYMPDEGLATFTVAFNANGGECSEASREVAKGEAIGELPTPTQEGYEFLGWYVEGELIDATCVVAGNITAVAHWKEVESGPEEPEVPSGISFGDTYFCWAEKWRNGDAIEMKGIEISGPKDFAKVPSTDLPIPARFSDLISFGSFVLFEVQGASSKEEIKPVVEKLGFKGDVKQVLVWSDAELRAKMPDASTSSEWEISGSMLDLRDPSDISGPGQWNWLPSFMYELPTWDDSDDLEWPVALWPDNNAQSDRYWVVVEVAHDESGQWGGFMGGIRIWQENGAVSKPFYFAYDYIYNWPMCYLLDSTQLFRNVSISNTIGMYPEVWDSVSVGYDTAIHSPMIYNEGQIDMTVPSAGMLYIAAYHYSMLDEIERVENADSVQRSQIARDSYTDEARQRYFFETGGDTEAGVLAINVSSARTIRLVMEDEDDLDFTRIQFFPSDAKSVAVEAAYLSLFNKSRYNRISGSSIGDYMQGYVTGTGVYKVGETVALTAVPAPGEEFDHWELMYGEFPEGIDTTKPILNFTVTDECAGTADERKQMVVKAVWREKYQFVGTPNNIDMGSVTGSGFYHNGENVTITATPYEGYAFAGWFADESCTTPLTENQDYLNSSYQYTVGSVDEIVYAKFVEAQIQTYAVSFDANGGDVSETSREVSEGEPVGELPVPQYAHMEFLGWQDQSGVPVTADTVVAADMALVAKWRYEFAFGGDEGWLDLGGGLWRSGATQDGATNSVCMVVEGTGAVAFMWGVDCEPRGYYKTTEILTDGVSFFVDGVLMRYLDGHANEYVSLQVDGEEEHVLTWAYGKDASDSEDPDCAWIKAVVWTPGAAAWKIPMVAEDADAEIVEKAIVAAGFEDENIKEMIGGSASAYMEFRVWAQGFADGEIAVVASEHAVAAYLLGAEKLFDNAPVIEISEVEVGDGSDDPGEKGTITLSVTVKDGENAVAVASEKVAAMFEATSALGDWDGEAKLTPTVEVLEGDGNTMRFKVKPGDGTSASAFLRIRR